MTDTGNKAAAPSRRTAASFGRGADGNNGNGTATASVSKQSSCCTDIPVGVKNKTYKQLNLTSLFMRAATAAMTVAGDQVTPPRSPSVKRKAPATSYSACKARRSDCENVRILTDLYTENRFSIFRNSQNQSQNDTTMDIDLIESTTASAPGSENLSNENTKQVDEISLEATCPTVMAATRDEIHNNTTVQPDISLLKRTKASFSKPKLKPPLSQQGTAIPDHLRLPDEAKSAWDAANKAATDSQTAKQWADWYFDCRHEEPRHLPNWVFGIDHTPDTVLSMTDVCNDIHDWRMELAIKITDRVEEGLNLRATSLNKAKAMQNKATADLCEDSPNAGQRLDAAQKSQDEMLVTNKRNLDKDQEVKSKIPNATRAQIPNPPRARTTLKRRFDDDSDGENRGRGRGGRGGRGFNKRSRGNFNTRHPGRGNRR